MVAETAMHGQGHETGTGLTLTPVLTRLSTMTDTQLTALKGLETLQQTLDDDVLDLLRQLQRRPEVDVAAITSRLDQTIDAIDRVMQRRIPRLIARRWWVVWVWLIAGLIGGAGGGIWWATQTRHGRQVVAVIWPQPSAPPSAPRVPTAKGR